MTTATVNNIKYKYFSVDEISELTCLGISSTFTSGENDTLLLFLETVTSGVDTIEPEEIANKSCGCCGSGDSISVSAYTSGVREEIDDSDEGGFDEQSVFLSSSLF
mmetsp:Transcript_9905/g.16259  ORF Transcript_9905/g.16259 Transcript_9905/m.16259 type:complete len:106 (+) Transcript_9905:235-552(+)